MKNLLKIGILLLGVSLFLFNCEQNENLNLDETLVLKEETDKQRFSIKNLTHQEVTKNTKVIENLEKIKKQSKTKKKGSNYSKDVYDATYDFTINTDLVNFLEDTEANTHSYNFPIIRNNSKNEYVENLSLQLNEDENYDAYIISYGFTPEEINHLDKNESHNTKIKITPIDFDVSTLGNDVFSKIEIITVKTYTWTYLGETGGGGGGCNCGTSAYGWVLTSTNTTVFNNPKQAPNTPQGLNTPGTGTTGSSGGSGGVITTPTISKPQYIISCNSNLLNIDGATTWLIDSNNTDQVNDIYDNLIKNNCSEEAKKFNEEAIKIMIELPSAKFERIVELNELLENDPWALIQDCVEQNGMNTSNYLDLYNLSFPQECSDRLFNMGVEWHHQPITDGNVPCANIDYYGVEITNSPDFNNDGNPGSEAEMYQAFRDKFIDLGSGELEGFKFSCDVPGNSTDTGDISWQFEPLTAQDGIDFVSNDPVTSILLIEAEADGLVPTIAADDGAVMVSDFTNNDWTISTIMTANNGTQPFSGNRQWGWLINQNGKFEFFTRAVDVANISKLLNVLSLGGANTECQQDTYYNIAEATWENMQQEIAQWVNNYGGQATINTPKAVRIKKETIEEILTTNESIVQILSNCN